MKIDSVRIQNFRCFSDETINLDDYTCMVGPNGAGKSSVLGALNVVFRNTDSPFEVAHLSEEDFHHKDTSKPITITVTFTDLSDEAKEDLSAYVRHGSLVLSAIAEWNPEHARAEVRQVGSRLVMSEFAPFFEAFDSAVKVAGLRKIYAGIRLKYVDLAEVKTKDAMRDALREYEEAHEADCEVVESGDSFYGWSKGSNVLERHVQWVYVPAVKDPAEEQDETRSSVFGKLLQRTIRSRVDFSDSVAEIRLDAAEKYRDLLTAENEVLEDVGASLQQRLQEWANSATQVQLIWNCDEQKSVRIEEPMARVKVGEGRFLGDLIRLGHGVQRSFLIALLQELIGSHGVGGPTLILAIEEPELYQHPPQARHFCSVLEGHSCGGTQVLLTTHSPYFVSGRGFESVRMTRKEHAVDATTVSQLTHADLSSIVGGALGADPISPTSMMAAVEQILQPSQSELFFSRIPIFVEGTEDVAFLSTQLRLLDLWSEFRLYGCHFIGCGGKCAMSRPVAIAKGFSMPFFCIFDGDANQCKDAKKRVQHKRDNGCLLSLCGHDVDPIPTNTAWGSNSVMWRDTIGRAVMEDIGETVWSDAVSRARMNHGLDEGVRGKNPLLIAAALEDLHEEDVKSQVLSKLCRHMLDYAKAAHDESS